MAPHWRRRAPGHGPRLTLSGASYRLERQFTLASRDLPVHYRRPRTTPPTTRWEYSVLETGTWGFKSV
jgi:hypothetical protein